MKEHIAILAAGSSSRMGSPKQLINWRGMPLLRHLAEQAIATASPVTIILGANADLIRPSIADLSVQIIENPEWRKGMSTSIRLAAQTIQADALLLMVCDQPLVTAEHLNALIEAHRTGTYQIIASGYADTLGVPALFDRLNFDELSQLEGTQGAKTIIQRHRDTTLGIPFPDGALDLDTPDDLKKIAK